MFMRNRYNILFSLFWASLVLVGIETQAQENLKFAPNDIPEIGRASCRERV